MAARAAVSSADGKSPGLVVDRSTVPVSGTVQVDVKVVEISKTVLKEIGLNFYRNNGGFAFGTFSPSSLTKATFTPGVGTVVDSVSPISSAFNLIAGSVSKGIFANLSLMEANGLVRVLAEPSLVALSGQSASFLAGGEIPIPVPQALGTTTIQYKPFGIGLTVSPTVMSRERIALKVAPEASDLDPSRGIVLNGATVPAIVTRRADTTIELGDGESFVIGGLVSRNTVSNVSKVPFLGDLPVIGSFFKNLNFHQEDRELMIVVTPHLIKPLAKDSPAAAGASQDGRTSANPNVWGRYMLGEYADQSLPGFSR
jgi:pilus assembly protein CpaC